jgi:hypothetical protein
MKEPDDRATTTDEDRLAVDEKEDLTGAEHNRPTTADITSGSDNAAPVESDARKTRSNSRTRRASRAAV